MILAIGVDKSCGEDAIEPGLEIGAGFELMEGDERLGISILNQVLGIVRVLGVAKSRGIKLVCKLQGIALKARLLLGNTLSGAIYDRYL